MAAKKYIGECKKICGTSTTYSIMDLSYNITSDARPADNTNPGVQETRYVEAIKLYSDALTRLARGYESQPDRRQDLLQDIHVALWRSFANFDGRCSLRTWVYRVAHIVATKHIVANRRVRVNEMVSLDEVPEPQDQHSVGDVSEKSDSLQKLFELIERLKPMDRQVILLYLEDFSAEEIGDVIGLSARNIATKIHRIKKLLTFMFHENSHE
jgi:RNA polymerase sigma-70 factor (ECF subfamily)